MTDTLFPARPQTNPTIYAYQLVGVPSHEGLLKVGYTDRSVKKRIHEQLGTAALAYNVVFENSAMRSDGTSFTDRDVHRRLRIQQYFNPEGEWFRCEVEDVRRVVLEIKTGQELEDKRDQTYAMRPEQEDAVAKTAAYFCRFKQENPSRTPHFLWNAKMRFGKTFASYQLAKKMNWTKILVLTFKPAVQSAWYEDLRTHIDFVGWQFVSKASGHLKYEQADKSKPIVCFGSFQDYLGRNPSTGGIKSKNEWVHSTVWDCIIFDEYHYGAWRENAKDLFEGEDASEVAASHGQGMEYFDEEVIPISTNHYLYLSGTPFRAIATGEFIEEQIYNWTYSDEQKAKNDWVGPDNPYEALPRMVMLTYQLPDTIRQIAMQGEFNSFDLNLFFSAEGEGENAIFRYSDEVQKWLDLIRGSFSETTIDNLKLGARKPPLPFSHTELLNVLNHTLWFLPTVASCNAMANLLAQKQNKFYHDYKTVIAAGIKAGTGIEALPPVLDAISDEPLKTRTITLSCGKLLTGISVKPWSGIFMLRNSSSPETYFQAAFRVQTPWVIKNPDKKTPNRLSILKKECYVFDFAPDRALKQIADYSCRLNIDENNPEFKVAEFINFLPVLAYDGSTMKAIDAAGVLDMAMSGTTATLLARRWKSALLVNVDNGTLTKLMANETALNALMKVEGFRTLSQEIETIINKSNAVKNARVTTNDQFLPHEEQISLSKEEKELKNLRRQVQEKLIKFATRIPIFMYLTDYRERSLRDVITQLEPALFKKVTGLSVPDFELLVTIGVFNSALMNDAIYKFKRYEDASLEYIGINRHLGEDVGLYDTVLSFDDYERTTK